MASRSLTLEESARRVGGYRWLESRLFELLGSWVTVVEDPVAKAMVAAHAREHAHHAGLWHEQLPAVGGMTPDGFTQPPGEGAAALVAALADPGPERPTLARLVATYRVLLPRMVVAYTAHLQLTSAVCDGPVTRVLRSVLRDEVDAWARGEAVVQSLLGSEEQVRFSAHHQARLESLLVPAGGASGPETARKGFGLGP